jgi:hypothetical protein
MINDIDKQIAILEEKTNKLNESERLYFKSLLNQIKGSINEYKNYSKWADNDTIYNTVEKEFLEYLVKIEKLLSIKSEKERN